MARSLGGGLANCPDCERVNPVRADRPEWLFVSLVGAGALGVLAAGLLSGLAAGWPAGLIVLLLGGALLGGLIAAS